MTRVFAHAATHTVLALASVGVLHAGGSAPLVTVTSPNGGESIQAGTSTSLTWVATDETSVSAVDLYYRDGVAEPWTTLATNLSNTGTFAWHVPNTPTTGARVRVVARDPFANEGEDVSDSDFTILQETGATVLTTLRDFRQPGTQPHGASNFLSAIVCQACHSGFDPATEPGSTFLGTMMANSLRDPIFHAALAIAEQDAASSGDLCLRCHTPPGWLSGRSVATDGSLLIAEDFEGVSCQFCHRLVDPEYAAGTSPAVDEGILTALGPDVPAEFGNGMYVVDPIDRRRGPYDDAFPPHGWLESPFHREAGLCGTCHDVSNPVFERVGGADYDLAPLDAAPASLDPGIVMPVERTYSEWLASDFVMGVYAPDFAGNKPDGIVSSCVDCHMADAEAKGCGFESAPVREDLAVHDLTGGNTWVPNLIAQLFPGEVSATHTAAATARAVAMLERAAVLGVTSIAEGDSFVANVTVTNRTGHKLPTGYPEGRRMWVNVTAYDVVDQIIYESGAYETSTGVLTEDSDIALYEAKLGISTELAAMIGEPAGPSFHFVLNDSLYQDNRIPPQGFTNAAFDAFGAMPVDPDHPGPGPLYADGQYWDTRHYALPPTAFKVIATLYYQTISKEYVEFLRDENTSNAAGTDLYALWTANGRAAPVVMARDTTFTDTVAVPNEGPLVMEPQLATGANPFRGTLELRVDLRVPARVELNVFDVRGRRIAAVPYGTMGGGAHRLMWDGRNEAGNDMGAGVFFIRVQADQNVLTTRVVKLK